MSEIVHSDYRKQTHYAHASDDETRDSGGSSSEAHDESQHFPPARARQLLVPLRPMPERMSACATYTSLMLLAKHGYPLHMPNPRSSLPPQYRSTGLRIGDVGLVTRDGAFDFLFNICETSTSPINRAGVPRCFVPVSLDERAISETRNIFQPGTVIQIEGGNVLQTILPHAASTGEDLEIRFSGSNGALLTLPNGAGRFDYQDMATFRRYAYDNAPRWYDFAVSRGRFAENGSLNLITGTDTACTWESVAFSKVCQTVVVHFTSKDGQLTISDPSLLAPGTIRRHLNDTVVNQAVFARGLRITLRGGLARLKGRVELTNMDQPPFMTRDSTIRIPLASCFGRSHRNVNPDSKSDAARQRWSKLG